MVQNNIDMQKLHMQCIFMNFVRRGTSDNDQTGFSWQYPDFTCENINI